MSSAVKLFSEITAPEQTAAGGKGGALARLYQLGYPVPDGFIILSTSFENDQLTDAAWQQVKSYLDQLRVGNEQVAFAVRSSAMSEDSTQASFAGEFETVLNVHSDEQIRKAVHTVYHSKQNERVQAYSRAKGLSETQEIAVIVQLLVPAQVSGVMFTANPLTGERDQVMLSAAWGLGEAIVSGQVTPDTLVMDKSTRQVLSRQTADKQVQTLLLDSGTQEQPIPEQQRHRQALSDSQAAELVQLGLQIEADFGMPMDIEWALAGDQFSILQARPITALPEPQAPIPTEWKLPEKSYIAIRNNIVELMAEPLTPLFATLGLSAVNTSMKRLLTSFFGRPGLFPDDLIITVNSYAYYNGSWSAGQLAQILFSSIRIMKYMFTGAVERWTEQGRPRYVAAVEQWRSEDWRSLPAVEILDVASHLSEAAIDAYGALVSGVIPAAWISEGLFTYAYKFLIKRRADPPAFTYLLGFDSLPIQAEKWLYDLATWSRGQAGLAVYLENTPSQEIAGQFDRNQAPTDLSTDEWQEWHDRFQEYLDRYGYTIYNLDFANPVPADDPVPVLETLKLFVGGQGVDPYARQHAAVEKRQQATQTILSRLKGLRLRIFNRLLNTAQRYAPLREDGLADVGLSYPLLRQMLRELGVRFTAANMITEPDDVFWLTQEEVDQAARKVDRTEILMDHRSMVKQRRATWCAANQATPPRALPQSKLTQLKSRRTRKGAGETLKGVAASPGQVTAPACVLHGPEDFSDMNTGDVLVAALTTPAWTPLFARASAVVTDIGGPLSHGSIVAREYGIPAVLGTGEATRRIRSGQLITVDGTAGLITLST
jgi:phosphoenolpyruvate synthase/pyruvate phosphate dikinase